MQAADWIVDIGRGGADGGWIGRRHYDTICRVESL